MHSAWGLCQNIAFKISLGDLINRVRGQITFYLKKWIDFRPKHLLIRVPQGAGLSGPRTKDPLSHLEKNIQKILPDISPSKKSSRKIVMIRVRFLDL